MFAHQENNGFRFHVLASGSKGNAAVVQDMATGKSLLIDCGICKRDFLTRCAEVGVELSCLEGILITHDHSDHTKGLGVVLRGLSAINLRPTLFVSDKVRQASTEIGNIENSCDIQTISQGESLSVAGMEVRVFSTSHDAAESFGFRVISSAGDTLGYMTDTGIVTDEAFAHLSSCRILALESNHDTKMLSEGPYPYVVKRRIVSDEGHLSNEQAATALESLLGAGLEQVIAMHISENNNTYRFPLESFEEVVARNAHPAHVQVAYQHRAISVG